MIELNNEEKDAIGEVGNISMGAASTALSAILDKKVNITTPQVSVVTVNDIKKAYPVPCVHVEVEYLSGLQGKNVLLLKEEDALLIASVMMGGLNVQSSSLGEMELSAVREAMNQMMGFVATTMSEMFKRQIDISPPRVELRNLFEEDANLDSLEGNEQVVQIQFTVSVEDVLNSILVQIIPVQFAKEMVRFLFASGGALDEETAREMPPGSVTRVAGKAKEQPPSRLLQDEAVEQEWEQAAAWAGADLQKLALVKDIPVNITVILGQVRLPLGKLFALGKGGLIDLDRYNGEPVEILANGRLVARGEVVCVNGQIGTKITSMGELVLDYKDKP